MSSKDVVTSSTGSSSAEQLSGRVKWFNNKQGFGFITISDGERAGSDVFVHHSAIKVGNQQYKYLVQGEYVEFNLIKSDSENHEFHAADVSGIMEGILMCETHRLNNSYPTRQQNVGGRTHIHASNYREDSGDYPPRSAHRNVSADGEGFSEVRRRKRPTQSVHTSSSV